MKRGIGVLLALLGVAGCSLAGVPSGVPEEGRTPVPAARPSNDDLPPPVQRPRPTDRPTGPTRTFDEVRALWVVRTTLTHPDSIREMVRRADQAGFNTLLVQIRGRGDAFYRSRWEPRPLQLWDRSSDFDPLEVVIREAHDRGLAVHGWVNSHLVWGPIAPPEDPLHIVRARPDLLAVPRPLARELFSLDPDAPAYLERLADWTRDQGGAVEGFFTSPSHPEVQEHLYSIWMDLVEGYDLDGLHFDYIRYPSDQFDYSRAALLRFRNWVAPRLPPDRVAQLDRAFRADPLAWVEALPGPWGEFRRAEVTATVERIYHGVKKRRPGLLVTAAVFANRIDAYRHRFQDWAGWIDQGILDAAVLMAYTNDDALFRSQVDEAVAAVGDPGWLWIGVGAYQNSFDGTVAKVRYARSQGVWGVSIFSYDWAASEGGRPGGRPYLEALESRAFER